MWTKKRKGAAVIWTHPEAKDGRAIVVNHYGVRFNGRNYSSLEIAKAVALRRGRPEPRCVNAHDRCYGGAGGPCPYCE